MVLGRFKYMKMATSGHLSRTGRARLPLLLAQLSLPLALFLREDDPVGAMNRIEWAIGDHTDKRRRARPITLEVTAAPTD